MLDAFKRVILQKQAKKRPTHVRQVSQDNVVIDESDSSENGVVMHSSHYSKMKQSMPVKAAAFLSKQPSRDQSPLDYQHTASMHKQTIDVNSFATTKS